MLTLFLPRSLSLSHFLTLSLSLSRTLSSLSLFLSPLARARAFSISCQRKEKSRSWTLFFESHPSEPVKMPPKPEVAAPPRKETLDQEASNQLMQLTLFGLLAIIVWFVAVEQPKLDQIAGLRQSVLQMQKQAKELKAKLASTDEEMRRVEKASPTGLQASSMKVFQKEYEQRVVAIRDIVDDVQRQLGVERKQREEIREKDREVVGQLSQHLKWLDKQVQNVREELDGANRLEKANAMLEGRLPTDFVRPYSRDVDGPAEPSVAGGTQGEGGNAQGVGSVADVQDATGGLVELRHGDFPKLLQDGDSWVKRPQLQILKPWVNPKP